MTTPIDELLKDLRKTEKHHRYTANVQSAHAVDGKIWHRAEADRIARLIAAVEQLRMQASLHAMANSVVVNERTADGDQTNT